MGSVLPGREFFHVENVVNLQEPMCERGRDFYCSLSNIVQACEMEFGCRYIYIDESRGENNVQLESHLSPVPVSQNGVVLGPRFYDNRHPEEKPRNGAEDDGVVIDLAFYDNIDHAEGPEIDAEDNGLQHCTVSLESNVYQDLQPISPVQLEDQKTPVPQRRTKSPVSAPPGLQHCTVSLSNICLDLQPISPAQSEDQKTPPVPQRRTKSPVSTSPGPNEPHCILSPSNIHTGLRPTSPMQLHGQKTPPPVPARKQMATNSGIPSTFSPSTMHHATSEGQTEQPTIIISPITEKSRPPIPDPTKKPSIYKPSGVTELERHAYEYGTCEDSIPDGPNEPHCMLSPSNTHIGLRPTSPVQLDGLKKPPPVPSRRQMPTNSGMPSTFSPSNMHHVTSEGQTEQPTIIISPTTEKSRPPIPDRTKKPSIYKPSGVTEPETHAYEYATYEDSSPDGVTKPETHAYEYATCEDSSPDGLTEPDSYDYVTCENSSPNDLPQDVTIAPNDHNYLEVLPAVSTEMKMQTTSVNLPDHPMATSSPPIERLPANCNILLLNIGKMVENSDTDIRASPLLCIGCSATCSKLNHVDDTKTWTCVFCAATNHLSDNSIFESREEGDELYAGDSQSGNEYSFTDQAMIIFCIDISGSMSVTTEVTQEQCNDYNIMYKTRMEAVKSALDQTLDFLYKQNSEKRVALVTFSNQVKLYGDGTIQPLVLQGAELLDPDHLKARGEDQPMPQPLVKTLDALKGTIQCLKEKGATALGPAALVSIAMASKSPGSKVIICTDGRANTDLGNLEDISEEYVYQSSKLYYSNLGDLALQHSVVVSVVTIEGTNCRLPELGQLADKTGGKVNIVHPFKLANEFQSIMEEEIIATDVKLKVFLPQTMYFLYEGNNESVLERTFGSITADAVLSTEFDIHSSKIKEVLRHSQLPIQLHLTYTLPDGRSRWRILSQRRPVTNDGTTALESIDLNVLQIHSVQFSARLAMEGHVNEARTVALELKELIDLVMRNEKYEAHGVVYEDWENCMAPIYEDLQEFMKKNSSKKTGQDSHIEIPVVKTFSDEMAKMIFHMKRAKNKVLSKLRN